MFELIVAACIAGNVLCGIAVDEYGGGYYLVEANTQIVSTELSEPVERAMVLEDRSVFKKEFYENE